ncbi:hypothetical protein MPSEU_001022600 [Mayamaea pseudoterrestris]|nr:hypothetical protein MPSEU_001022600 [Mayamaea pseudoterrestris]
MRKYGDAVDASSDEQQRILVDGVPVEEAARNIDGTFAATSRTRSRSHRLQSRRVQQSSSTMIQLLDRLVAHLVPLPDIIEADDDNFEPLWEDQPTSHLPHQIRRATGITLPAAFIAWLSDHMYHGDDDDLQGLFDHATSRVRTGYPADASLDSALQERLAILANLLPRLTHLRIINDNTMEFSAGHNDDGTRQRGCIDLGLFPNCKLLLIDQVVPESIYNLHLLRKSLEVLRIERCYVNDLSDLFQRSTTNSGSDGAESIQQRQGTPLDSMLRFSRLTHIKLSYCELNDASISIIQLLPRMMHITSVCLSHNYLSSQRSVLAMGLANKLFLSSLDLSFNNLRSAKLLSLRLRNLTILNLSHNCLTQTKEVDQLVSLRVLHIDFNRIADLAHMANVASLPVLQQIYVKGNPLLRGRPLGVRVDLLELFSQRRLRRLPPGASYRQLQHALPVIDGKLASIGELHAIRLRTYERIAFASLECEENWIRVDRQVVDEGLAPNITTRLHLSHRRVRKRRATIDTVSGGKSRVPLLAIRKFHLPLDYKPMVAFTLDDVVATLAITQSFVAPDDDARIANVGQDENANAIYKVVDDDTKRLDYAITQLPDEAGRVINLLDETSAKSDKGSNYTQLLDDERVSDGNTSALPRDELLHQSVPSTEDVDSTVCLPMESSEHSVKNALFVKVLGYDNHRLRTDISDVPLPRTEEASEVVPPLLYCSMLSPIKQVNQNDDELKESAATTASTLDFNEEPRSRSTSPPPVTGQLNIPDLNTGSETQRPSSPSAHDSDVSSSQPSQSPFQHNFRHVASFGGFLHDEPMTFSVGSPRTDRGIDAASTKELFQSLEARSVYSGPRLYAAINILENLDLYFRVFVFDTFISNQVDVSGAPDSFVALDQHPKIQLWPIDRRYREGIKEKARLAGKSTPREDFRRAWSEKVVACGLPALRRLTPNRAARYGFHGELLWSGAHSTHLKPETIAENRDVIMCLTDLSLYIVLDHDSVTEKTKDQKRAFPLPIATGATFDKAKWPHALAYHPLQTLKSISIGFGFQRMTLRFANTTFPVPDDFTYVLLTSNKTNTISLLKEIQALANEAKTAAALSITDAEVQIDNDDRHVLDAIGAAVAPDHIGAVLHYQVLTQRWKSGDRGMVRRVCILTDNKLYLMDEDYVGDGSQSMECGVGQTLGDTMYRVVDSADLAQVKTIQPAGADPKAITISVVPSNRLARTHNWRLVCRNGIGAERLVEDLRKAIALAVGH